MTNLPGAGTLLDLVLGALLDGRSFLRGPR
jgi:hypothetical protein